MVTAAVAALAATVASGWPWSSRGQPAIRPGPHRDLAVIAVSGVTRTHELARSPTRCPRGGRPGRQGHR